MPPEKYITPRGILLDTCAAIWLMAKAILTQDAEEAIRRTQAVNAGIFLSPFSAWEIGMLVAKNRIQLTKSPEDWVNELLEVPGVRLAALTPAILIDSTSLPGNLHNDPADRIIVATARRHGYTLITRDRPLLDYAKQGYIQAIAC